MKLPVGSCIDDYVVLGVLGQGSFGIIYLVEDRQLALKFALKEYFPADLAQRRTNGDVQILPACDAAYAAGMQRFLNEGQTLARLDHPYIARVLRHFEANGTTYLLMPRFEGKTLHQMLLNGGTFSPAEVDALVAPLLEALEYLDDQGVVHGDIKPSNIIITPQGLPVLIDFGAARVLAQERISSDDQLGSQGYAALEQSQADLPVKSVTDIYGLAATLYRLVSGEIPPKASARASAVAAGKKDPFLPLANRSGFGAFRTNFLKAVDRGLSLYPKDRPQDARYWHGLSSGAEQGSGSDISVVANDPSERVIFPQLLAGLIIVAVLSVAAWVFMGEPKSPQGSAVETPSSLPETSLAQDDESWEQAVRTDTAAGFRAYLEAFPNGRNASGAKEQLAAFDQQRWSRIQNSAELTDFIAYLEDFPDGRFVVEAQSRSALLQAAQDSAQREQAAREAQDSKAYTQALTAGTTAALDDYLTAYPGGLHVADAIERKATLERQARDEAAWSSALESDRRDAYEAYLNAHPDGRYLPQALAAIDRLTLSAGKVFRDCPQCPEMVVIAPGAFQQGADADDSLARSNERPKHQVRLSQLFAIGLHEVTFEQWDHCVRDGDCRVQPLDNGWGRGSRPVIMVNWVDAQSYVAWLSARTGETYDLPTESQWEYVARAGESTAWVGGSPATVCAQANIAGNETGFEWRHDACSDPFRIGTAEVGYFVPNAMGVYDMVGNVAEWTRDCMNLSYIDAPADGSAWARGLCSSRVSRGGSWFSGAQEIRLSARFPLRSGERNDFTGLRVVREVNE